MSKTYIVKAEDETQLIVEIGVNSTGAALIATNPVSFLTPYEEPDLEAIKQEAYQKGLNDAWDAARKIVLSREDGGLFGYEERKAVFGCGNYMALKMFLAPEAIEKIRQYEQEQDRWIPVSKDLPKKNGDYLVTCEVCGERYVEESFFCRCDDGDMFWTSQNVIAWQPRIKPYTAEEES